MQLSRRLERYVHAIGGSLEASIKDRTNPELIDLAVAENRVSQSEILELYKATLKESLEQNASTMLETITKRNHADVPFEALVVSHRAWWTAAVLPEHVVAGAGATACLTALLNSICDPGDAVLIPGLYWSGFDFHLSMKSGVHIIHACLAGVEDPMEPSQLLGALHSAIDSPKSDGRKIRAVVLTNPGNPSGRCYARESLEMVSRFCQIHDLYLIVDEVYALSRLRPTDAEKSKFVSALSLDLETINVEPGRVAVVWCTSKDFGSSGIRMGCVVSQANPELRTALKLQVTTDISSLAEVATAGLLRSKKLVKLVGTSNERLAKAYAMVTLWLEQHRLPYLPASHGLYVYARLAPAARTWADEECMIKAVKQAGVLIGSGRSFHAMPTHVGWARIIIAVDLATLAEALRRMEKALGLKETVPQPRSQHERAEFL
ncbi:hypothetical protein Q7P37_010908 [Cladosporium fusiforme]